MEVDIQVERSAEALDQGNGAGACRGGPTRPCESDAWRLKVIKNAVNSIESGPLLPHKLPLPPGEVRGEGIK